MSLGPRQPLVPPAVWRVWLPILLIASLHYLSPPDMHWIHDVARRLFYVPILLAAMSGGLRGGLMAAALVVALYTPHAFMHHFMRHGDPGSNIEKLLEMGFYLLMGGLAGALQERQERLSRKVEDQQRQLARAARLESLGQLTAGLAHEIRNPLHAMRGTAEVLLDAVPPEAPEHPIGAALIGEIDRLSSVLKRFLDFARSEPAQTGPVDLAEVVQRGADLLSAQARKQDTELSVELPDAGVVQGDVEQLVQVLLAIALNGLQALERGGHLVLHAHADGFSVVNDGPPISPAVLEKIFDPFVTDRSEGTGLGLSVAWRIVQAHGGQIQVDSGPDGVRFRVRLSG